MRNVQGPKYSFRTLPKRSALCLQLSAMADNPDDNIEYASSPPTLSGKGKGKAKSTVTVTLDGIQKHHQYYLLDGDVVFLVSRRTFADILNVDHCCIVRWRIRSSESTDSSSLANRLHSEICCLFPLQWMVKQKDSRTTLQFNLKEFVAEILPRFCGRFTIRKANGT